MRLRRAAQSQAQPAVFGVLGLAAFGFGEVELLLDELQDGFMDVDGRVVANSSVLETLS